MSKSLSLTRRQALISAASCTTLLAMPSILRAADKTVKVGALVPETGDLSLWGLPAKNGAEIWANRLNKAGGLTVKGEKYSVEVVSFDGAYIAEKTLQGARAFVDQDVKFTMVIGGDDWSALQDFSNRNKMLTSTLYVSDLNAGAKYLIAPVEIHPFYFGLGVQYLRKTEPAAKTVALCAQDDVTGRSSLAAWRAGFDAHDFQIVADQYFDNSTTDFAPVVSAMLSAKPDVACIDTSYPSVALLLVEQLFTQGFKGKILHAGFELLPDMVARTSKEFMEGSIAFFPRFDDPSIAKAASGFDDPAGFYQDFIKAYPKEWNNTSWEFPAALQVWKQGVEGAGSFDADQVLASMKANPPQHIFGKARWWGKELFGADSALVGNWPVVAVKDGKVNIVDVGDQVAWYDAHKDVFLKRWREEQLMPDQKR
ncbi:ABC transporter substrate-binding protein [Rhizobium sp. NZLR11]|uniref:ABC transporter substrate-binding protein n=1 Tax=Rhizobium sp. NZLR11 TaxID=2731098 RepID=UPI001C82B024|nr:ABC transporter substrate-binding protein [Rhizobium sp. NZLR11]MBX5210502.1 ABC transporter substrate-binding protein [Rhizobium sp. NZLR11]